MILDVTLKNYMSFAGEGFISFVSPRLTTETPREGESWGEYVNSVAVLYGANASGKSTLVRGVADISYALYDIGYDLHKPTAMKERAFWEPTEYTVNFTVGQNRYQYQVHAHSWGIGYESLDVHISGEKRTSKRMLFTRTQKENDETPDVKVGASLRGQTQQIAKVTGPRHLFLAVAHKFQHEALRSIAAGLRFSQAVETIMPSEDDRLARLRWVTQQIAEDPVTWGKIADALVKVADTGVTRVEVDEQEINPEKLAELKKRLAARLDGPIEISDEVLKQIGRSLTFYHRASETMEVKLSLGAQSEGTKNWLALAGEAVSCLQKGKLLVIDELDMSLHPELVATFVELFKDPNRNVKGAQLLCTTHDTNLLNNKPVRLLEPEEVWFVEKDSTGVSESYSLHDFRIKKSNNAENQYLAGVFGAVPSVRLSELDGCLSGDSGEPS